MKNGKKKKNNGVSHCDSCDPSGYDGKQDFLCPVCATTCYRVGHGGCDRVQEALDEYMDKHGMLQQSGKVIRQCPLCGGDIIFYVHENCIKTGECNGCYKFFYLETELV